MDLYTIDAETFYSKEYSLSKITTEEYVRDPRFELIGLSVKKNGKKAKWLSGDILEIYAALHTIDWSNAAILAHNTLFDGAILAWRLGIKPKLWLDTLSMSRAIHGPDASHGLAALAKRYNLPPKGDEVLRAMGMRRADFTPTELAAYGKYCKHDTDLCYQLFNIFMGSIPGGFPKKELQLIDMTLRMFTEPQLQLNKPKLEAHLIETVRAKQALLDRVGADKKDLMSNDKFAGLLQDMGVDPPRKVSATTGKEAWAFAKTDEEFKALLEHDDPDVQALVAARLGNKSTLEETRTARFIGIADRGMFPVPLRYYGAHTGRWSGCLVADTAVTVLDTSGTMHEKKITDVMPDDLVWDGVAFVQHEGVVFSGFAEVIEWDGVRGTEDHVVFTDAGEIGLRDAMQGGHYLTSGGRPDPDAVDPNVHRRGRIKV
jgi:hypothetical protein